MKKLLVLLGIGLLTVSCGSDDSSGGILEDVEEERPGTWTVVYEQEGDTGSFNQILSFDGDWKGEPPGSILYMTEEGNLKNRIEHESEDLDEIQVNWTGGKKTNVREEGLTLNVNIQVFKREELIGELNFTLNDNKQIDSGQFNTDGY